MKQLRVCLTSVVLFFMACNNAGSEPQEVSRRDTPANDSLMYTTPIPHPPLDGCYELIANVDTVTMRLNVIDSFVTGDLSYRLHAKDRNDGSLKGVVRDSLIVADYTFRSEGMLSVRQVVFKIAGTSLVEGYGDIKTGSDTVRFKDVKQLNFLYDRPLRKTSCIND